MERELRDWVARWWAGGGGAVGVAASGLLWPAEQLFRAAVSARDRAYAAGYLRSDVPALPTLSVGNLTVGGAGKTPVAAWIAGRLRALGRDPAVVLRGYGRDEILVHRELNPGVPVYADARRTIAIARAAAEGHDCAVLDDAFQHRAVRRDLDVVVVAADGWRGSRRLLPRGPWREPLSALRRAHLAIVTRKGVPAADAAAVAEELRAYAPGVAVCALSIDGFEPVREGAADGRPREWISGREVLVVTAIGDPESFVRQLRALGARPEPRSFPDHHDFSGADAAEIVARASGRPVVVTRKDAVKLRDLRALDALDLVFASQRIEFELGGEEVEQALARFGRS